MEHSLRNSVSSEQCPEGWSVLFRRGIRSRGCHRVLSHRREFNLGILNSKNGCTVSETNFEESPSGVRRTKRLLKPNLLIINTVVGMSKIAAAVVEVVAGRSQGTLAAEAGMEHRFEEHWVLGHTRNSEGHYKVQAQLAEMARMDLERNESNSASARRCRML